MAKVNLDLDFDGKTRLKDWWEPNVKDNFQTLQNTLNGNIDTENIADGAVTTAKIANGAVKTDQIAGSAVTTSEIASNAVTTAKIADANVTYAKLASDVTSVFSDLQSDLDAEEADRKSADDALQGNIDLETSARDSADTALGSRIDTEAEARARADASLSSRVTAVEGKAHTHDNKTVLDGITADDVEKWNGIKKQVTQTELNEAIAAEKAEREAADATLQTNINSEIDAHTEYETDIIQGLLAEIQLLYGLIGITVYDGGLFTQEEDGDTLDGGAFDDTDLTAFDCGDFEPITAGATAADVDGGEY